MRFLLFFAVLMLYAFYATAQTQIIPGQVRDENGKAVPFVSVFNRTTGKGVASNADGTFKIDANPGDTLFFSSVNFLSKAVVIGSSKPIMIILIRADKTETEVIVTAQDILRKRRELGYAVGEVSVDDLTNGRAPLIGQGLSGKVSGLVITNTNSAVNPALKFTLRGYRSMSGNNSALIVIDGLPVNLLGIINPEDVESITVLKGGQAATIYGSQGINGAIIINTKKGQKGKLTVKYSSSFNFEKINNLAQFQDQYGSGSNYTAGFGTPGYKTNYLERMRENWRSYENQQYGDAYDGSIRPVGRTLEDGSILMLPYAAIKGIRDKIWNTGFSLNNQVSFTAGTETSRFYFSAEHNRIEGIVPKDKSERTGARFAASQEYGKLKLGFTGNYIMTNTDRTTYDFYGLSLNQPAHVPLHELKDWRNNKFAHPNGYFNDYYSNPFFELDNNRSKFENVNFNGSTDISYQPFSWLSVMNKFAITNSTSISKATVAQFFHSNWAKEHAYVPAAWDQQDGLGIARAYSDNQGGVADNNTTSTTFNNNVQIQIQKQLNSFSLKVLLGYNTYMFKSKNISVNTNSLVVPDIYNVSNRRGELGGSESNFDERRFGYYTDAVIGWKDMIFLHSSFRRDASSRFFKPNRKKNMYAYSYPGIDLSIVMTNVVPELKNKILNYARLRLALNKNGNDNIGLYGLDRIFFSTSGFPYGNNVGLSVGPLIPDANLKPEFVHSIEAGGEFRLFNDKVNVDLSWYHQKSIGQILTVTIPFSTGFRNLLMNAGSTKNWGYEADIKVQVIRNKKLIWNLSVLGSMNDNKAINLYPDVSELFISGYSNWAGTYVIPGNVFPMLKAVAYDRDPLGRILIDTATGYPLAIDAMKNMGRVTPKYMAGLGTSIQYGPFSLSTNWEYRGGNVCFSGLGSAMTFTGSGKWTSNRAPHLFPNTAYFDGAKYLPNTSFLTREAEYELWVNEYDYIAENFTVPAWFIKMRDINLTYSFPANIISRLRYFSSINLAVYGRNLITVVDEKNDFTDPEFSYSLGNGIGISETFQTQPVKQFGISINFSFK